MKKELIFELHESLNDLIGERVMYENREYDVIGYNVFYSGVYHGLILCENIETGQSFLLDPDKVQQREQVNLCYGDLYEALFHAEEDLKNEK